MKQHNKFLLILILAPFVFSFAFGLDIYVPIVPEMQRVFHTTPFMVQLTLSLFLLINGVGQLFIGPLSDQFGRYRIITLSGVLFIVGSVLSALSVDIGMLIVARMLCTLVAVFYCFLFFWPVIPNTPNSNEANAFKVKINPNPYARTVDSIISIFGSNQCDRGILHPLDQRTRLSRTHTPSTPALVYGRTILRTTSQVVQPMP